MNIPGTYSQRDPSWASDILGNNPGAPWTIGNYGCLVTALANMCWYMGHPDVNPRVVNQRLKAAGGFTEGGGLVIWSKVPTLAQDMVAHGTSDLAGANSFVQSEGNFVVLQVHKAGFPMHYVLLVTPNRIVDSWDGEVKYLTNSGYTVDACHLYGDITPDFTTHDTESTTAQNIIAPEGGDMTASETPIDKPVGELGYSLAYGRDVRAEDKLDERISSGQTTEAFLRELRDSIPAIEQRYFALLGRRATDEGWKKVDSISGPPAPTPQPVQEAPTSAPTPVATSGTEIVSQPKASPTSVFDLSPHAKAVVAAVVGLATAVATDPTIVTEYSKNGWKGAAWATVGFLSVYFTKNAKQ